MSLLASDNSILDLFTNPWFWSAFLGWMVAQIIKIIIALKRTHVWDFTYLFSTGGMPSAHSSLVSSLATAIGLTEGFNKPITILAVTMAMITMFDASTVRYAAGQHARVLNELVRRLISEHRLSVVQPLKELLGHTRKEVFAGMALGCLVANLVIRLWRS